MLNNQVRTFSHNFSTQMACYYRQPFNYTESSQYLQELTAALVMSSLQSRPSDANFRVKIKTKKYIFHIEVGFKIRKF